MPVSLGIKGLGAKMIVGSSLTTRVSWYEPSHLLHEHSHEPYDAFHGFCYGDNELPAQSVTEVNNDTKDITDPEDP